MTTQHFDHQDILNLEQRYRANLINGIGGYKPAALIGTCTADGRTNLAIFNSIIHIGAHPPLIGFLLRPTTVARHTYNNIKQTGFYTINHVSKTMTERAHYTAAKFNEDQSEFEYCNLAASYLDEFKAPYVDESVIKIGVSYHAEVPVEANGTLLIIGKIEHIYAPKSALADNGNVYLCEAESMVTTGLDAYSLPSFVATYPYPRPAELPDFTKK